MSGKAKLKIAEQLRKQFYFSYSQIAKKLCVHPSTVYEWFREKKSYDAAAKTPSRILQKQYESINDIQRSVKFAMTGLGPLRTALREDAIKEVSGLHDKVSELSMLPEFP
jgi:transposase